MTEPKHADEPLGSTSFPAHVRNPAIPATWRYGLVVWLLATLALLLTSDIGSGVQALSQTIPDERLGLTFESEVQVLLEASVFTSVGELWKAGSKPLSIFVAITSITWPYVKLLLTFFAWLVPIRNAKRRESLITALDLLGKWSFADIVVFTVIVVVFRETIPIGAGFLEVWIRPQWGLYGFISASMLSLLATHAVLYHHRRVVFGTSTDQVKKSLHSRAGLSRVVQILLVLCIIVAMGAHLAGCLLYVFDVTKTQQGVQREGESFSIASIGQGLPDSGRDGENDGGLIYLQIVWFLLGVAMPLVSSVAFLFLLLQPKTTEGLRSLLLIAEISLAWSCAEVYVVSTILAIREIPTFGEGLTDTGCSQCYTVETSITAEVAAIAIGTAFHLAAAVVLLRVAHKAAYPSHSEEL